VSGANAQFFLPQALTDPFSGLIGGQNENGSFLSGIANTAGGLFNVVGDVGGSVARPVHDAFGAMTRWNDPGRREVSEAVYTAMLTYDFRPSGPFFRIAPIEIHGFSSILSHPFAVVRSNDPTEFTRVFGDPDAIADTSGHIFPLWLFPSPPPDVQDAFGPASQFLSTFGGIFEIVKTVIVGLGGLLNQIPIGNPGWKMPGGTLKEYPEFHQKRQPAGNTSANAGNRIGR
jgi:hypothetical protein